jgi:putative FmdB family regulatory protein
MPIHKYNCDACQNLWEELQIRSTDKAPTACPECGAAGPRLCLGTPIALFQASDGVGGWTRQPNSPLLVRAKQGKNTTSYGEGSV